VRVILKLQTAPTIEPISLDELKLHLRLDSSTFAANIDETQLLPPGSHAHTVAAVYTLIYETLTLDVAPGGAGWAAGDTLTGVTSTQTCIIAEKLTATTYTVKNRTGAFTLGEVISNGTATADQGAAYPTFTSRMVDVLGYQAAVVLDAGTFTTGTADVKIQDSDDGITWTDWTGGAFTQVTTANDNATQEIAYTGTRRYIRTAGMVLVAACPISTTVVRLAGTTVEDTLLEALITAGREQIEDITGRQLLTATWDYCLNAWPQEDYIKLPFGNLQSVTSVKWKDTDGTETTLVAGTDYLVETNGDQCGRLVLPHGVSWPTDTLYPSNPVTIRFMAGWTTAALVPFKIKAALQLICADLYEHREAQNIGQSFNENRAVQALLASARLHDEF